jgi:hypothetical protein
MEVETLSFEEIVALNERRSKETRKLSKEAEAVHDQAYEKIRTYTSLVDKVDVLVDPFLGEMGYRGGILMLADRFDIVVSPDAADLRNTKGAAKKADAKAQLEYTIVHEYGHLFETMEFFGSRRQDAAAICFKLLSKDDSVAIGEGFAYWFSDNITGMESFDYLVEKYEHLDRSLMKRVYDKLDNQHGSFKEVLARSRFLVYRSVLPEVQRGCKELIGEN